MCVPKNTRDQKRTCTAYKDEWQDAAKEGLPGHGRWGERSGRRRRRRRIVGEQPKRRRRQMYLGIPLPFSCNQRDGKSLQITVIALPLSLSFSHHLCGVSWRYGYGSPLPSMAFHSPYLLSSMNNLSTPVPHDHHFRTRTLILGFTLIAHLGASSP